MYIGKIIDKVELPNGQVELTVEFSDGVDTETRTVTPQDKRGFEHWVTQVAESLTTAKELKEEDNVGKVVEIASPQQPKAELDKQEWFTNYGKLVDIQKLIDLGVLTGSETKVVALRNKVKTDFKPSYFSLI